MDVLLDFTGALFILLVPYLLCSSLVSSLILMVNPAEVGNDNWNRKSNNQHTTQRANRAKNLAGNCLGHHVAITSIKKREKENINFRRKQTR